MNTTEQFERDLREDLQRATSYAGPSLPEVDAGDLVVRGARVVRRRRIAASVGVVAAASVVAVAVATLTNGSPRADLRPANGPGVVVTHAGTAQIQVQNDASVQNYDIAYSVGHRGTEDVVDVRLRGDDGRTHELSYTATEISRGVAVTWLNAHEAAALAAPSTLPLLVSSIAGPRYPQVSTGSTNLPGLNVQVIVNHYRATASSTTPLGLVWQTQAGPVTGSPSSAVTSTRVSTVGRTVDFWASDHLDRAGIYYPSGQLDVPWRVPGHLSALRDDDPVGQRTILLVQVPSATVSLDSDATNPGAPHGIRPTSVTRQGSSWWAVFETPTLPKTSRVHWTEPDGSAGSGTVQAESALG